MNGLSFLSFLGKILQTPKSYSPQAHHIHSLDLNNYVQLKNAKTTFAGLLIIKKPILK